MKSSVIALTKPAQVALQALFYALAMPDRHFDTPAARIAYAIEQSGKTLEVLGDEIGCSHAALSQWRSGSTIAANIKAGLLNAFAERTGTDVRWLLTGEGPAVSRYLLSDELARVSTALAAMERHSHEQVETIVRMVEAAAGHPTAPS